MTRSSTAPTADHAYTQFVAYEYYDKNGQKPQSEAALQRAANGPEASWEIYSRLIDVHVARGDWAGALKADGPGGGAVRGFAGAAAQAHPASGGLGRCAGARALLPKCKSYDIDELTDACKKAADGIETLFTLVCLFLEPWEMPGPSAGRRMC